MAKDTIFLEVATPDAVIFRGEAVALLVPASEGYLGVLPGHAPLLASLRPGLFHFDLPSGESRWFAVAGGLLEVTPERTTLLADAVERPDEIDVARAEVALARAAEELTTPLSAWARERAEAARQRAKNRLAVAARRGRAAETGTEDLHAK
jgi:F-type H+-transporting ATPase subunit epsilon